MLKSESVLQFCTIFECAPELDWLDQFASHLLGFFACQLLQLMFRDHLIATFANHAVHDLEQVDILHLSNNIYTLSR